MEQITRSQFLAIPKAYRGVYSDVQGVHPEWKGRRTAFLPGHGTTLFIEGVSFEIVDAGHSRDLRRGWSGVSLPWQMQFYDLHCMSSGRKVFRRS